MRENGPEDQDQPESHPPDVVPAQAQTSGTASLRGGPRLWLIGTLVAVSALVVALQSLGPDLAGLPGMAGEGSPEPVAPSGNAGSSPGGTALDPDSPAVNDTLEFVVRDKDGNVRDQGTLGR